MLYKHILKPLLFQIDPEKVHDAFIAGGELLGSSAIGRSVIGAAYGYHGPDVSKTVDGIRYRTPFLLAAGFDYNGRLSRILSHVGLGGEEIGSVTARPCAGNPRPRMSRLPKSRSILVNKGLRNDGVDAVISRLKRRRKERLDGIDFVTGVSIARTNDAISASDQASIEDYCRSFKLLNEAGVGDFYTINISCPNAFGGESFARAEKLNDLLAELSKIPCSKPVYVKMPINLPWAEFDALLRVIDERGLRGVVIGNLNKDYASLDVRAEAPAEYRGGLSGRPCRAPSTELIRRTRAAYGRRFTIMGVGGVMSPAAAMEKLAAGADLVQLITGMIYEGPGLIRRMCRAYCAYSGGKL